MRRRCIVRTADEKRASGDGTTTSFAATTPATVAGKGPRQRVVSKERGDERRGSSASLGSEIVFTGESIALDRSAFFSPTSFSSAQLTVATIRYSFQGAATRFGERHHQHSLCLPGHDSFESWIIIATPTVPSLCFLSVKDKLQPQCGHADTVLERLHLNDFPLSFNRKFSFGWIWMTSTPFEGYRSAFVPSPRIASSPHYDINNLAANVSSFSKTYLAPGSTEKAIPVEQWNIQLAKDALALDSQVRQLAVKTAQGYRSYDRYVGAEETSRLMRAIYMMDIIRVLLPIEFPNQDLPLASFWKNLPPWDEQAVAYVALNITKLMLSSKTQKDTAELSLREHLQVFTMTGVKSYMDSSKHWIKDLAQVMARGAQPRSIYTVTTDGSQRLGNQGTVIRANDVKTLVQRFPESNLGPAELWFFKLVMRLNPDIIPQKIRRDARYLKNHLPHFDNATLIHVAQGNWPTIQQVATAADRHLTLHLQSMATELKRFD
ncbi:hypothetical protein SUNI508_04581 [Seiridium unicorne]|uniref:Uncharacterized protein n=1 Tax=Seiridium unicorne TaxID=138068 RepID=A0ABR2V7M7_9PEZI